MKQSRSIWFLTVLGLVLFLASFGPGIQLGWAQTVPPTPAVHPLYGACPTTGENGTLPPVFEPFLPNSIYVDWCGQSLLTPASPSANSAALGPNSADFDPAVGHRIGLLYTSDSTETGWQIAGYSYRIDFDADELAARKIALLRELCPRGEACNELLLANIGKQGARFTILSRAGEYSVQPMNRQLFAPYLSSAR